MQTFAALFLGALGVALLIGTLCAVYVAFRRALGNLFRPKKREAPR